TKLFGHLAAVDDVTMVVEAGERIALLGPSGCGKTTTLRLIAGFEKPDRGNIEIGDVVVADAASGRWIPPERRGVGMVFQDYALFPHLSVAENVGFGLAKLPRAKKEARVDDMLQLVGLSGLGGRNPHQLSGGQQQRVALARALAPNPIVLLLDEPFSNLDAELRAQMRDEVVHILSSIGATALLVTHDQQEAFAFADRVAVLHEGRLEQMDTPWNLYHSPATKFVANFVGQASFLPVIVQSNGLLSELGLLPLATSLPGGSRLEILLRPESVSLQAHENGDAIIESAQFRGSDIVCVVKLKSGRLIRSLQPATVPLRRGIKVQISLGTSNVVAFLQEQALPLSGQRVLWPPIS
ncbi:MAG: ABC transporter ATP-binding protein, partial [Dehalococcoidia bacterium]|nr:ABC transporter ATP-binding protein [Dehalococcoidia bacterium]